MHSLLRALLVHRNEIGTALAAGDGAGGDTRQCLGIAYQGPSRLQHLINIHFSSAALAARLRQRPAMLYFVYSRAAIVVLVAHDLERGALELLSQCRTHEICLSLRQSTGKATTMQAALLQPGGCPASPMQQCLCRADWRTVAMHSCSAAGEFVAQVPYFPPLQGIDDFTPAKCREVLDAAAGAPVRDAAVHQVRPWTMHAQVAEGCASGLRGAVKAG